MKALACGALTHEAGERLSADIERATSKLTTLTEPGLVHGDLHGENMLVGVSGDVHLIDLEDWGVGEPMQDLAHFFMEMDVAAEKVPALLATCAPQAHHASRYCEWVRWTKQEPWAATVGTIKIRQTEDLLAQERTVALEHPLSPPLR
jgi:thiamine kinase-like enzyme